MKRLALLLLFFAAMPNAGHAKTYEEHMADPPDVRAGLYFGYFWGALQSDRTSAQTKEMMMLCAITYAVKTLQADIERDLANLKKVSGKVYDVAPLIGQAMHSTCVRKMQR